MPKAVLKNGVIYPLEPLPPECTDGRELRVESADEDDDRDLESWFNELQAMVAQNDPNDLAHVDKAIRDAQDQAKALVRRQMGLP
jgi:hypothetical protein